MFARVQVLYAALTSAAFLSTGGGAGNVAPARLPQPVWASDPTAVVLQRDAWLIDSQAMFSIFPVSVSPAKAGCGKIYVVDGSSLRTFEASGAISTPTITPPGSQNYIEGVAVGKAGKIYIVNGANGGSVTTYNANGTRTTPTIADAGAIAVDSAGKIYLVGGNSSYALRTYNADGTRSTPTINGLNNPGGVAVDSAGKIYIANIGNFNRNDGSVTTYKANGMRTMPTLTAGLRGPIAVAVDSTGKIFVTSSNNYSGGTGGTLTTYDANGRRTSPTIVVAPNTPGSVAVGPNGKIYIASYFDHSGGTNVGVATYFANGSRTTPTLSGFSVFGIAVR